MKKLLAFTLVAALACSGVPARADEYANAPTSFDIRIVASENLTFLVSFRRTGRRKYQMEVQDYDAAGKPTSDLERRVCRIVGRAKLKGVPGSLLKWRERFGLTPVCFVPDIGKGTRAYIKTKDEPGEDYWKMLNIKHDRRASRRFNSKKAKR